jgi:Flp pilus assembly protein TadD
MTRTAHREHAASSQQADAENHPVEILLEDSDPLNRSRAHTELGRRAVARSDVERAAWHFREAFELDPTDETPRDALRSLGQPMSQEPATQPGLLGRLWKGLRHRTAS